MTTKIKLDSKIGGGPSNALEPLVRQIWDKPGTRFVGVVEFAHVERTEPAPDTDGDPSVKIRMSALEVAPKDHEGAIREVMRAMYSMRTARGTLDEEGELQLSKSTVERAAGLLTDIEVARLRAGLDIWVDYTRRVSQNGKLTQTELRHEVQNILDGLTGLMRPGIS